MPGMLGPLVRRRSLLSLGLLVGGGGLAGLGCGEVDVDADPDEPGAYGRQVSDDDVGRVRQRDCDAVEWSQASW